MKWIKKPIQYLMAGLVGMVGIIFFYVIVYSHKREIERIEWYEENGEWRFTL